MGGLKYIGGPSLPFQFAPQWGAGHGPNHPERKNDSEYGGVDITIAIFLEENKHHIDILLYSSKKKAFDRVNGYIPRGKHAPNGQGQVGVDWLPIETETREVKKRRVSWRFYYDFIKNRSVSRGKAVLHIEPKSHSYIYIYIQRALRWSRSLFFHVFHVFIVFEDTDAARWFANVENVENVENVRFSLKMSQVCGGEAICKCC